MTEHKFDLRVAKLELEPEDFLIFKTDFRLTNDQAREIRKQIVAQCPPGVKYILLTAGIQVEKFDASTVPLEWKDIAE